MIGLIYRVKKRLDAFMFMFFNKHRFKRYGKKVRIYNPIQVDCPSNIEIGDNVTLHYGCWIAAKPLTGGEASLSIENGSSIGNFNHIYATNKIVIGKSVLTADKVYISDNMHEYIDVSLPIIQQPIRQCKDVYIGDGSWLGENVCVIGASIGKNCVIGANSVVTHDIPDYCVAVGAPAKVIKKYCFCTQQWVKV